MRLIRYQSPTGPQFGVDEGGTVRPLHGDPFGSHTLGDQTLALQDLTLLAPIQPRQILGVGLNYTSHLGGRPAPTKPELFWKPPSAVVGPGEAILLPPDAQDVHAEGELVIVIGRQTKGVSAAEAMDHVFGYTIGNDLSDRHWQQNDRQWWRAKGCDTFAPIGPAVVTDLDYRSLTIETRINGGIVQQGSLADLLFDVGTIVAFVSQYVTLLPGDMIFSGTPGHTRALQAGDAVTVAIDQIGVLANPVQALP